MRNLTVFAFVLLLAPAALAQGKCDKPASEMTPDEYVECVSIGGVKNLAPASSAPQSGGALAGDAPQAAGRGVTAAGSSESDACSKAKARAGGNARGECNCSPKSAGRYDCTIPTANILAR